MRAGARACVWVCLFMGMRSDKGVPPCHSSGRACVRARVFDCQVLRVRAQNPKARECFSERVGLCARASAREFKSGTSSVQVASSFNTRFPQKRCVQQTLRSSVQRSCQTRTTRTEMAPSQQGATRDAADGPDGSAGAVQAGCQWAVLRVVGTGPGSPTQRIRACDIPFAVKLEEKARSVPAVRTLTAILCNASP